MTIYVSYSGALDTRLDAKIRRAAGMKVTYLGSGYEPMNRHRDLKFRSKTASDAHEAVERIKKVPVELSVVVA